MENAARKPHTFLPIQRKVLLTFALSSVIAVVLVAGALRYVLQKATLDNWEKDAKYAVLRMALRHESKFVGVQSDLEFVAKLPAFSSLPYVDRIDPLIHGVPEDVEIEKREVLRHLQEKGEGLSVLYVLRPNADIYLLHPFAVQRTINRGNLWDRPYFQEAARTKRPVVSDSFVGADGLLCVVILVPILDQAGSTTAYLGGVFHLDRLSQPLAKDWIVPFDMGFVVDRQGYLIAHTNTDLLREGVRERTTSHPLVAEFLSSQKPDGTADSSEVAVRECVDRFDAKTYITAFVPMRLGWGFGLARSKAAVLAEIRPIVWGATALSGVLFLAVSGMGVFFARRLGGRWEVTERERKRAEEALRETNEYLENLFNYANAPIIVWDPQFRITRFNHAFESLTGRKADDVLGESLEILFPPALVESSMELIRKTLSGERWETVEISILHLDGSVRTVLWNSANVLAADGKTLVATIAQGQDITARKREEENLRRMATVVRDSNDAITIQDFEGRITAWNRGAELMYGYSEEEALLANIERLTTPGKVAEQKDFIRRLIAGEAITSFETQRVTKDGRVLDVWMTVTKLLDDAGKPIGLASTERDITARKRAEEVKKTLADLERSNKELEQFAYVASHDLQEPLRMVASFTQLLGQRYGGKLDKDADDFIRYAVDGANRMQALINDLLSYSRISTHGKVFEPTDTEAVLARVHANLLAMIEETGTILVHDPLPTVKADETQMVQLFQNLVQNAVKFRRDEAPRIHVAAQREGDEWVFSVRDNGIGIDAQYFDRIFVIFQRLHGKEEYPGTGIGLAVCKRIVERHAGRIWVESELGKGSTFHFALRGA